MDGFEIINESGNLLGDYLKCKHCGQRVERGALNVTKHLFEDCPNQPVAKCEPMTEADLIQAANEIYINRYTDGFGDAYSDADDGL
jgi:hypothetical protein